MNTKEERTRQPSIDVPGQHSGRFTCLDRDKLRGGYYTSQNVAAWLCTWGIRSPKDRVLEPSCGDRVFLEAAAKRYSELGVPSSTIIKNLTGVEIVAEEANRARARLKNLLGCNKTDLVTTADFFDWWQGSKQPNFNVVVGNPPFIRYQSIPEPHRSRAMEIMLAQGLSPNRLTNIWVPFVVAATASLQPGGRLAIVLPAELLQVTYARQLRSYLTECYSSIDIVTCNELFFEKAEQEVVLLLADGALAAASKENCCRMTMIETQTRAEITNQPPDVVLANKHPKILKHDEEKWLKYFLTEREITFMRTLRAATVTTNLSGHASVDVGVVTGKNAFFVLTGEQVDSLKLDRYTTPLVSRSEQLKGALVDEFDWKDMASVGKRVHLLNLAPINGTKLSSALASYIRYGEVNKINEGYKCSIRSPWYVVPSVWSPDGFLFRQIHDFPRVVLNKAGATSTDTIHRLTCKVEKPECVIANTYTWLTAASAEIEGRSYGGGVLELEPTEAERLLMPGKLNGAMPLVECDKLIRAGRLDDVLEENARIVLMGHMGLSKADCFLLRDIWTKMRNRRMARRRRGRINTIAENAK